MRPVALLAVVATIALPRSALTQQPTKTDTYLLQLAAAVSGYSGGQPVYVVICGQRAPYKIAGAYPTSEQATTAAAVAQDREHAPCGVEGPYTGPAYPGAASYGTGCKKAPDSSCLADSTVAFVAAMDQISRVTITYTLRGGATRTDSFSPREVEAVFFTMAAVDRMLIPYFVKVYGIDIAARQREQLLQKFRGRP